MVPKNRRWKVTFEYPPAFQVLRAVEYVEAPTRLLARWKAREQRHGCMIADPDCVKETVGVVREVRSIERLIDKL